VSHNTKDPTRVTYVGLTDAYDWFNRKLFDGALPAALITMQRRRGSYGYFASERFGTRDRSDIVDEIALNPVHFEARSDDKILSTLVHEMCHLWPSTARPAQSTPASNAAQMPGANQTCTSIAAIASYPCRLMCQSQPTLYCTIQTVQIRRPATCDIRHPYRGMSCLSHFATWLATCRTTCRTDVATGVALQMDRKQR